MSREEGTEEKGGMEEGGKETGDKGGWKQRRLETKNPRTNLRLYSLTHTFFLKPQSKWIWMRKQSNQRGNSILLIYKFMSQIRVFVSQLEVLVSQLCSIWAKFCVF